MNREKYLAELEEYLQPLTPEERAMGCFPGYFNGGRVFQRKRQWQLAWRMAQRN